MQPSSFTFSSLYIALQIGTDIVRKQTGRWFVLWNDVAAYEGCVVSLEEDLSIYQLLLSEAMSLHSLAY